MKRPSDLLRKRPLRALGVQAVPAVLAVEDVNRSRAVWRACFGHLAAGGLISRASAYPMGLTAHFLIRTLERDPSSETALSVSALHRTMLEDYRPAFDVAFPAFAVDVERWGSVAGYDVSGDDVRGVRWRKPAMEDDAMAAFLEALGTAAF
jgi:hypothetical protein